jgi:hypothetical protein
LYREWKLPTNYLMARLKKFQKSSNYSRIHFGKAVLQQTLWRNFKLEDVCKPFTTVDSTP